MKIPKCVVVEVSDVDGNFKGISSKTRNTNYIYNKASVNLWLNGFIWILTEIENSTIKQSN